MNCAATVVGFAAGLVGAGLVLVCAFEHGGVDFKLALYVHIPKATWAVNKLIQVGK